MKFNIFSLFAFWRRPRSVVLDLRPLQCGYAGKGIGRYTLEIARRMALASHLESQAKYPRYKISSLVLDGRPNPIPEIPVLLVAPPWKRPWLWDQLCLPYLLLRNHVRIFHNFVFLGPLPEVSFPMLYGFRGIATLHDWHMFAEDASPIEKFYRKTLRIRFQRKSISRLRHLVVDAEQIKVDTLLQSSVKSHQIKTIPLGCEHLDTLESESWQMENFVLSIGDTPNKNLSLAFKALSQLRAKFIHLNWVIVGSRKNIEAELSTFIAGSLPSWISILENPTDEKLKGCYQNALCLLFPSTREGFGIPVLEAMRLGCPVLAADIEPLSSLLAYPAGLVSPTDPATWAGSINKLLYNPTMREAAIQHGLSRSQLFSWNKAAESLLQLYRS